MIEFTKSFKVGDKVFATMEEAQMEELTLLFDFASEPIVSTRILQSFIKNKERVVDILTTKAGSLPKARKVNGGTKKRAAKPVATPPVEPMSTQPAN
jgi:hypothetical protein